jgi:hypothetical protein
MARKNSLHLHCAMMMSLLLCALLGISSHRAIAQDKDQGAAGAKKSSDQIDLRPEYVVGRNAVYDIWSRRETTVSMSIQNNPPREITSVTEVDGQMRWNVEQVNDDGSAICIMTIQWLRIIRTDQTGKKVNDSREGSGDDETRYKFLKALTGVPLRVRCQPDGSIEAVEGSDDIAARVEDKDNAPEELDWIESATELATISGIENVMKIGNTWNRKYEWNHEVGKMHHNIDYKLAGVETIAGIPIATVTGGGDLEFKPDLSNLGGNSEGMDISLTKGTIEHQIMFDLQRHEAVGRNSVEHRTIRLERTTADFSAVQSVSEIIQSQALRVREEE